MWSFDRNEAFFGGTQQGKSVLANERYSKDSRIGVFFAPDPESYFVGKRIRSKEQFVNGLKKGHKKFIIPVKLWGNVEKTHAEWCRFLLDRCDKIPKMKIVMVHDEAQDLDQEMLKIACKRGLKRGFRNILTTQSPAAREVSLEPLRQCEYYGWVGPAGSYDINYIKDHGLFDPSSVKDNDKHEYTVVTRTGKEVARGYPDVANFG